MKKIEIYQNDCILSDYGKIICNGKEYDVDYFIKKISNTDKIESFLYSKETKSFVYRQKGENTPHHLKLSNKYLEELKVGIIDPEVEKLIKLVDELALYNFGKIINESINNTGAIPSNKNELVALKTFFDMELKNTNTTIVANSIGLTLPVIFGGITLLSVKNATTADAILPFLLYIGSTIINSLLTYSGIKVIYFGEGLEKSCITTVKDESDKKKTLIRRREEVIKKLDPLTLKEQDDENQTYNSSFLNIYKESRLKINELPTNLQKKYSSKLENLMKDYIEQLDSITNEAEAVSKTVEYSEVYRLNGKYLREMITIYYDICSIISDLKKMKELKSNCQKELSLTQALIETDHPSIDFNSYSTGYEKGFGSTGVAYMADPEERKL